MHRERLGVYFLDVGQGDCSFVVGPRMEADPVLFDCADAYVAERFVKDHRIRRLSAVVVSHLDRDHIGGLLPFLCNFLGGGGEVGTLYVSIDRDVKELSQTAAELLEQALVWHWEKKLALAPSQRNVAPEVVCEGVGWKIEVVLPGYADVLGQRLEGGEEPNPCSAVLRVTRGGTAVLIGGDAPLVSWVRLEPVLSQAIVLRTPHHGGGIDEGNPTWTEQDLYARVSPEVAVVSVGTNNGHEHPRKPQMEAIRGRNCRLLCTQLTTRCHVAPLTHREEALEHVGGVTYPYRHLVVPGDPKLYRPKTEVPCAGSMVAWLDTQGTLGFEPPAGGWHDNLVMRLDHPMCQNRPPF